MVQERNLSCIFQYKTYDIVSIYVVSFVLAWDLYSLVSPNDRLKVFQISRSLQQKQMYASCLWLIGIHLLLHLHTILLEVHWVMNYLVLKLTLNTLHIFAHFPGLSFCLHFLSIVSHLYSFSCRPIILPWQPTSVWIFGALLEFDQFLSQEIEMPLSILPAFCIFILIHLPIEKSKFWNTILIWQ